MDIELSLFIVIFILITIALAVNFEKKGITNVMVPVFSVIVVSYFSHYSSMKTVEQSNKNNIESVILSNNSNLEATNLTNLNTLNTVEKNIKAQSEITKKTNNVLIESIKLSNIALLQSVKLSNDALLESINKNNEYNNERIKNTENRKRKQELKEAILFLFSDIKIKTMMLTVRFSSVNDTNLPPFSAKKTITLNDDFWKSYTDKLTIASVAYNNSFIESAVNLDNSDINRKTSVLSLNTAQVIKMFYLVLNVENTYNNQKLHFKDLEFYGEKSFWGTSSNETIIRAFKINNLYINEDIEYRLTRLIDNIIFGLNSVIKLATILKQDDSFKSYYLNNKIEINEEIKNAENSIELYAIAKKNHESKLKDLKNKLKNIRSEKSISE